MARAVRPAARLRRAGALRARANGDWPGEIVAAAGAPGVRSLADVPLSLGLTKACVRRADLLVTTDSGPRHFAAAFGTPVVTLFGPTHIAWTETYYPKAVHLQKKVECGPCQLRVCPLDHRCMTLLTPDEVFAAAERTCSRASRRRGTAMPVEPVPQTTAPAGANKPGWVAAHPR